MGKAARRVPYWLLVSLSIVCCAFVLVDIGFTFTGYVAKNGNYSTVNLIFLSPYGIPLFAVLAWAAMKLARVVDRKQRPPAGLGPRV